MALKLLWPRVFEGQGFGRQLRVEQGVERQVQVAMVKEVSMVPEERPQWLL